MDSQRLILFFVFTMSVFLLYEGWQRDLQSTAKAQTAATTAVPQPSGAAAQAPQPGPGAATIPAPSATLTASSPVAAPAQVLPVAGKPIVVETDLYRA